MIRKISTASDASKSANLSEAVTALTDSIICRVAFGKISYEDQESKFHSLINEAEAMTALMKELE